MTITEAAQNKVDQVINGDGFLGIYLEGGGCSGYKIKGENMHIIKTVLRHIEDKPLWAAVIIIAVMYIFG